MNSLRLALVPGAIAGVISVFTSWLWVGLIFHRYQRRTPQTWRTESVVSHLLASAVQILACIVLATLCTMVVRGNMGTLGEDYYGAVWFAVLAWAGLAAPVLVISFIYVKVHPLVTLGQLASWLTTSFVVSLLTTWWLLR